MSYFNPSNNQIGFSSYNLTPIHQRQPININGLPQQLTLGPSHTGELTAPNSSATNVTHHNHLGVHLSQDRRTPGLGPDTSVGTISSGPELTPAAAKEQRKERKNRPGQKFGAKKKSWVWTWFIQDSQDPNVAACDYCGKIITRLSSDKGSPKKLTEHLKTHKLTRDSINNSRAIPIDGNGVTYAPNGMPISYENTPPDIHHPQVRHQPHLHMRPDPAPTGRHSGHHSGHDHVLDATSLSHLTPVHQDPASIAMGANAHRGRKDKRHYIDSLTVPLVPVSGNMAQAPNVAFGSRRFLSADFDNSPYTAMKFHKHLMKFLTENKLSINVIKSHSFQQLVYDLRSDSVTELLDLTNLYSSLLEVSRIETSSADAGNNSGPGTNEATVASSLAQAVEQKAAAATAAGRR